MKPASIFGTDTTLDRWIGLVQAAAARRLLDGACAARTGPRLDDRLDQPVAEVSSTEECWLYASHVSVQRNDRRGDDMARHRRQIFWGTLSSETDDFVLQLPQDSPELQEIGANLFMKVDLFVQPGIEEFVVENRLDQHQEVSILGHLGLDPRLGPGDHIFAERITSHDDIAVRAFEIYQSGRGQSDFDNWLSAEDQLLGA